MAPTTYDPLGFAVKPARGARCRGHVCGSGSAALPQGIASQPARQTTPWRVWSRQAGERFRAE